MNARCVSIIIINYNGLRHLQYCLPSLMKTEAADAECILVDNGSSDFSCPWVRQRFRHVRILEARTNLGFGRANHWGIEAASHDTLVLLNNDTEVTPGWLHALVSALGEDARLAAVCSTLELRDYPGVVNARGGRMEWLGFGQNIGFGEVLSHEPAAEPAALCDVLFPTAAAMIMRRAAYEDVGGFDTQMHMYHEDVDLGWRFWLRGWRVAVTDRSLVRHTFGGTSRPYEPSNGPLRMGFRHNLRSLIKNHDPVQAWISSLLFTAALALTHPTRLFWPTATWNARHLRDTLKRRKQVQKNARLSTAELRRRGLIGPFRLRPEPQCVRPDCPPPQRPHGLVVSPVLYPASASGPGRLAGGWYAPRTFRNNAFRPAARIARCVLKVQPNTSGTLALDVVSGMKRSREAVPLHITCNGHTSTHRLTCAPVQSRHQMDARSDADGMLDIELAYRASADVAYRRWAHAGMVCGYAALRFQAEPIPRTSDLTLSVVIPTYNRAETLGDTLTALTRQTWIPREVIVVDDGSSDNTPALLERWAARKDLPFPIQAIRQRNAGPGRARNQGVRCAQGDWVAFLGDDTLPAPEWAERHLRQHARQGPGCAVVGYTAWDNATMDVSPFLRFINECGPQFGYRYMKPDSEVPYYHFYTSNLSLSREVLLAHPFVESFRKAMWEDTELGYRLTGAGLRIVYEPLARTAHRHPLDMSTFLRRQVEVGNQLHALLELHPELAARFTYTDKRWYGWMVPALTIAARLRPVCAWLDRKKIRLPHVVYKAVTGSFYMKGIQDSRS